MIQAVGFLLACLLLAFPESVQSFAPLPTCVVGSTSTVVTRTTDRPLWMAAADDSTPTAPPPMFNGKRCLPGTIVLTGLKASSNAVAAVYAVLSSDYQKGQEGWEAVVHVGVTQDLSTTLQAWQASSASNVPPLKFVRALSFPFPQPQAMQDVANDWKQMALDANAKLTEWVDPSVYLLDDDDDDEDDDDEDDDWDMDMTAQAMASVSPSTASTPKEPATAAKQEEEEVISPFVSTAAVTATATDDKPFTVEMVDKVLDEVRPYLISDGGNVAVVEVDADTLVASLELQGACGSCASSTVTMQMGIERVLKENWGPNVSVQQVITGEDVPKSLSYEAVESEIGRLAPAVIAMGGVVRIVSVEEDTGVVKLNFRGANKVQQGLELALRDLPFVNAVQFVAFGDDDDE